MITVTFKKAGSVSLVSKSGKTEKTVPVKRGTKWEATSVRKSETAGALDIGLGNWTIFGIPRKYITVPTGCVRKYTPQERLEYLRRELRAERISTGELLELQSLAKHIPDSDVELLEAAGVPEGSRP